MKKQISYHVHLNVIQKSTLAVTVIFVLLIGVITVFSTTVKLATFGLFCQLLGMIMLGLGISKTNDELADIVSHHEKFDKQRLISHLTKDRFFIITGIFLNALGILFQIIGWQFL